MTHSDRTEQSSEVAVVGHRRVASSIGVATPAIVIAGWLHLRAPRPLTMDESFTVLTSGRSWMALVRGCLTDIHMSAYYVALKLWGSIVGTSLEHLRWFSLVAFAVLALGIASFATSRRRPWMGCLVAAGLAVTPMFREATVDARAGAFAAAASVWLVLGCDRWLGDRAWPHRRIAILLVGSAFVAVSHPSTLFVGVAGVGLVARFARQERDRRVMLWCLGAAGFVGLSGVVAALQSGAASTVTRPGLEGVGEVLSQLPGGRVLAGLAFLATVGVLLAGRAFDDERIVRWFAGASTIWFAVAMVALPAQSVWVPRYFLAATALLSLALAAAAWQDWSRPVITATVALSVVGGAAQLGNDYGYGSTWCSVAEAFDTSVASGDTVILASSAYASPIVACLGDQAVARLASVTLEPRIATDELDDPRTLWRSTPPDPTTVLGIDPAATTWYLTVPGAHPIVDKAIEELRAAGVRCTSTGSSDLELTGCANP